MKFTKLQDKLTSMFSKDDTAPTYLKGKGKPKEYNWKFGKRSIIKMDGIDENLKAVTTRALQLSPIDFGVTCGLRTQHEQNQLMATGKTQARYSRHQDGMAVDVVAYVDGKVSWEIKHYVVIAQAFAEAARELDVKIRWGAAWTHLLNDMGAKEANHDYVATRRKEGRTPFIDGPHFEIPKK
jgi:peptidoglycan L-alanyl-D-glutamate endopeptidase CwlK